MLKRKRFIGCVGLLLSTFVLCGAVHWRSLQRKESDGNYQAGSYILIKQDATTAPTVGDDSGDGYQPGSIWTDVTGDKTYFCQDATVGAAVWVEFVHSQEAHWQELAASKYMATPSDTDTLAMSDTTDVAVGVPIRYTISSVVYYGQVVVETGNTSIDIVGASLGGDVMKLEVGQAQRIVIVPMYVDSTYGDGAEANLLAVDMTTYIKWRLGKAYCVSFSCIHSGVDTGTEPKINIQINNAQVSSNDSNNGVQLGAAATWVNNSAVAITTANYDINLDEELEVQCTVAGGTGDAEDLTVIATFVLE